MQIDEVMGQLQELFAAAQPERIEDFLSEKLKEALEEGDTSSVLTLINELIGFYRDTAQFEKALLYCGQSRKLMERLGLQGTVPYAKGLLNVANAYRAAGMRQESLEIYEQVKGIYKELLQPDDFDWAAYYNNLSLLYQEMGEHAQACEQLGLALGVIQQYDDDIKTAVSHSNLAVSLMQCGRMDEAAAHIQAAMDIFDRDEVKDFHYSATAAAAGDLYYHKKDYEQAIRYYEDALVEQERNCGRTAAYQRILSNMYLAYEELGRAGELKGLSLAEEYYNSYGKSMIHEKFAEYEDRIAVGLVGEGSDCLGMDDLLSMDHDFGPGFCMWLSDDVHDAIGEELQREYEALPKYLHGISRQTTATGEGRVGVWRIRDFYKRMTGFEEGPISCRDWLDVEDYQLRQAVNGKVFADGEGTFSAIREHIRKDCPREVYEMRLAQKLALAGQGGQCNYARMMSRGQVVPAQHYLTQFANNIMESVYYLNEEYPPYEKWLWQGMEHLGRLSGIKEKIERMFLLSENVGKWKGVEVWNGIVNSADERIILIEEIAAEVIEELRRQGLTQGRSSYLERHGQGLRSRAAKKFDERKGLS